MVGGNTKKQTTRIELKKKWNLGLACYAKEIAMFPKSDSQAQ